MDGEYPTGTIASFTCDDDYMRVGSNLSTCQQLGNWSPEIPTCEEGIAVKYHYPIWNICSFYTFLMGYIFSHLIDIDECRSNPCENGGTCNDAVDMYTCDCDAGYNGDNCETSKFSVIHYKMKKDVK